MANSLQASGTHMGTRAIPSGYACLGVAGGPSIGERVGGHGN